MTVQSFEHFPAWRWPATKSAMNAAGGHEGRPGRAGGRVPRCPCSACVLPAVQVGNRHSTQHPGSGYCGLYAIERFPEDAAAFAAVDTARLLDIRQYCANAVANDVLVLVGLGTILRLLSALALAYIPRGLGMEPAVNAVARWLARRRRQQQGLTGATGHAP